MTKTFRLRKKKDSNKLDALLLSNFCNKKNWRNLNDISTMFPEKILEQLMQNIVMTRLESLFSIKSDNKFKIYA